MAVADWRMKSTAVCRVVPIMLVILVTAECLKRVSAGRTDEHRVQRSTINVAWWYRSPNEECRKRLQKITVTACGVAHKEYVPTCEGLCSSETEYVKNLDRTFQVVRNCSCCFIQNKNIKWVSKTYPGCPESITIPSLRGITCECNTCSRESEIFYIV